MTRKKGKFRKDGGGVVNNPTAPGEGHSSEDFPRSPGNSRASEQPSSSFRRRTRSASVLSLGDDENSSQILPHPHSSFSLPQETLSDLHGPVLSLGPVCSDASDQSVNGREREIRQPREHLLNVPRSTSTSHSSTSVVVERSSATAVPPRPPALTFQQKILLRERQQRELAQRNLQKSAQLRERQQTQNRQAVAKQVEAKRAEAEREKRLSDYHRAEIERLLSGRSSVASSSVNEEQCGILAEQAVVAEYDPPPPAELEHLLSLAESGRQLTHLGRTMTPRQGTWHRGLEIGPAARSYDRAQSGPGLVIANPSEALVRHGGEFARVASAPASLGREDLSKPPSPDHTSDHDEEVFRFRPSVREVLLPKPGNKKAGKAPVSSSGKKVDVGPGVVAVGAAVSGEDAVEIGCEGGGDPSLTAQTVEDILQAGGGSPHMPFRMSSQPKALTARTGLPGPKRSEVIATDDGREDDS